LIMAVGTIGGAEIGAQLIQMLKRAGNVKPRRQYRFHRGLHQHLHFHDLGEP